jgi:hypothetical protein
LVALRAANLAVRMVECLDVKKAAQKVAQMVALKADR